jgi:2-hydroxy-6-oxonona-2,4-dienedioate hydrolase
VSIWSELNAIDFTQEFVDVDGVRTRALRAGTGPDVICLHGTSGHLEAFFLNVVPLVEAGFTVHAIDMLGHGYTSKPDIDYTPPAHVKHLRSYVSTQTSGRVSIIGESLGGWVGAFYAAEYPEDIEQLVLVAPGGSAANPEVMDRIKRSTEAAVLDPSRARTRERLELLMHDPAIVTDELVDVRHAIYTQPEFREALPHILCLQNMSTREQFVLKKDRLVKVECPTLLFWGRQNPFGQLAEADFLQSSIPNCVLEVFEDCGHWPQYEKADDFNRLVVDFLTTSPAGLTK